MRVFFLSGQNHAGSHTGNGCLFFHFHSVRTYCDCRPSSQQSTQNYYSFILRIYRIPEGSEANILDSILEYVFTFLKLHKELN